MPKSEEEILLQNALDSGGALTVDEAYMRRVLDAIAVDVGGDVKQMAVIIATLGTFLAAEAGLSGVKTEHGPAVIMQSKTTGETHVYELTVTAMPIEEAKNAKLN